VNACVPGGAECAEKIAGIMGVKTQAVTRRTAVVRCGGGSRAKSKYVFAGIRSCVAANRFYSGSLGCAWGCLGLGDCQGVCPRGAITVSDGLASVNKAACVGCELCVAVCPNGLIAVRNLFGEVSGARLPAVDVRCSCEAPGKFVRSVCENGCIGCKICEKKCPNEAVKVVKNLAVIDYERCVSCGTCVDVCPVKVIKRCME